MSTSTVWVIWDKRHALPVEILAHPPTKYGPTLLKFGIKRATLGYLRDYYSHGLRGVQNNEVSSHG